MIRNFTILIVLTFIVNTYASSAFDVAESQSTKKVNTIKSSSQKIKSNSNYKKKLLKNLIRKRKIIESK